MGARRAGDYPALPLEAWQGTKDALHRFAQMVGKVRMALAPWQHHWWHVTLYVTARGLTTSPMPYSGGTLSIDFDFIAHELVIRTSTGSREAFALTGLSCSAFYGELFRRLGGLDIRVAINANSYGLPAPESFPTCHKHRYVDPKSAHSYWQILSRTDVVFKTFAGRFMGKTSPVHLFWHSFDLAVTRFSGRPAPDRPRVDAVTREAYSEEVISFGFWPGDDRVPAPAFYSYTAPEPSTLVNQRLRPTGAHWSERGDSHLALFMYDDMRNTDRPEAALLDFLVSAFEAGSTAARWPAQPEYRPATTLSRSLS